MSELLTTFKCSESKIIMFNFVNNINLIIYKLLQTEVSSQSVHCISKET